MANEVYVATKTMVVADDEGKIYSLYAGNTYAREGHVVLDLAPDAFKPMVPTFEVEKKAPAPKAAPPATPAKTTGRKLPSEEE